MTASVRTADEIIPPTIGAAIRLMTSDPEPVPYMIGSKPAMIATTVIIFAQRNFLHAIYGGADRFSGYERPAYLRRSRLSGMN